MKKVLLIFMMMIPVFVFADECDLKKYNKNVEVSKLITYSNDYNEITKKYDITFSGVSKNLYFMYGEKKYKPSNNEIKITNIPEGSKVSINVYGDDGCEAVNYFYFQELYYNPYYNSLMCSGYEDKLVACSSEFTKIKITEDYLKKVIDNYDKVIVTNKEKEEAAIETVHIDFKQKLKSFALNWGIKIIFFVFTTVLSSLFYINKYRKIIHGV